MTKIIILLFKYLIINRFYLQKSLKDSGFKEKLAAFSMKTTNSKDLVKVNQILPIMQEYFGNSMNLARIKLMAYMLHALCVVQAVSLHKLASAMPTSVERDSNLRRIQRFIANYALNLDLVARMIFSLLPVKPSTGERIRTWWLFNSLKVGQEKFYYKLFLHKGQYVYLAGSRIKNSEGIPELQILICFNRPEDGVATYKKRWEIETAFRAMKSSGFNIEDTHLRDRARIARLFAMVCMALVWAYLVGEHKDIYVKPIKILKHGRRAKSLVKYGLEEISNVLFRPTYTPKFDVFKFLSCT